TSISNIKTKIADLPSQKSSTQQPLHKYDDKG
ncbi:MAG: hypothetical protein ACI87E_002898, partial [Mariniblastus sp.]